MLKKFGEKDAVSDRGGEEDEVEWYPCPSEVEIGGAMYPIKDIEISTEGQIRHSITEGLILGRPRMGRYGMNYRYLISLARLGTMKTDKHMYVSRLIAMTVPIKKEFDYGSETYDEDIHKEVHHLNGIGHDDHPQNLAWVSGEENKWISGYLTYQDNRWRCDGKNFRTPAVFEDDSSEDDSD